MKSTGWSKPSSLCPSCPPHSESVLLFLLSFSLSSLPLRTLRKYITMSSIQRRSSLSLASAQAGQSRQWVPTEKTWVSVLLSPGQCLVFGQEVVSESFHHFSSQSELHPATLDGPAVRVVLLSSKVLMLDFVQLLRFIQLLLHILKLLTDPV